MAQFQNPFRKFKVVIQRSDNLTKIVVLGFLVVAIAAAMVLRSRILDARARAEALRSQAISLEQENADLQEKLDSVGSVEGIMQVAQEELDMVDPASVIFTPVN